MGWARSQTRVNDAERSLRPDEQLGEIRSDRGRRRAAGRDDAAVGEHDLEADDHVLDLAVAGGVLAGAAAGHPATDRGDVEALGEVADRQAVVRVELPLEVGPEHAGLDLDDAGGLVDVADPVEPGEIEHHAAEHGHGCPADTRAPAGGGDRHACAVTRGERPAHLPGARGPGDDGRASWYLSGQRPVQGERPPISAGFGRGVVGGLHLAHVAEPFDEAVGEGRGGAGEPAVGAGQFDRRDGAGHVDLVSGASTPWTGCLAPSASSSASHRAR